MPSTKGELAADPADMHIKADHDPTASNILSSPDSSWTLLIAEIYVSCRRLFS
jgi:hypothetical protein